MKVLISRLNLVALLGKIQTVVPTKPSVPILANVLIEAIDDQLIISATDLTVSMRIYTEAKITEEGAIVLPARHFFHLIRELTAPMIEIHTPSPDIASINAGSSHFKIHGIHRNEFPSLPDLSNELTISLTGASFKQMLSRTAFAAAKDNNKQILQSLHLQQSNQITTLIGTDGKRMAKINVQTDNPLEHTGSYIIPLKAVDEMIHILDDKEAPVQLTLMPDKIAIEINEVTLISKLLSGQYPDITRIIPEKKPDGIILHREELSSLLRQISLFIPDKSTSVRFTFTTGELHLSANNGAIGEGSVNMPVNYTGEKLDIALNPHFFLDTLRHSKDETVYFNILDSYNPVLITDSSTAQFVIMPMRLEE